MFRPTSRRTTPAWLDDKGIGALREQDLNDVDVSPVGSFVQRRAGSLAAGSYQNIAFCSVLGKQSGSFCLAANARKGQRFFEHRRRDSFREQTLHNFNL